MNLLDTFNEIESESTQKPSGEKDTGLLSTFNEIESESKSTPVSFTQPESKQKLPKPQEVAPERGIFGDIASELVRGTYDTIEQAGRALQTLDLKPIEDKETEGDIDRYGQKLVGWAETQREKSGLVKPDESEAAGDEGWFKQKVREGFGSLPQSMAPLVGAGAGFLVGGPAGALVGGAIGVGTLFGLGTYHEKMEEYEKDPSKSHDQNVKDAATYAMIEAGGEAVADLVDWMLFKTGRFVGVSQGVKGLTKATLKSLLTTSPKEIAKRGSMAFASEWATETGQAKFQSDIDARRGLGESMGFVESAIETAIPTAIMTLTFGLFSSGLNATQKARVKKNLNSDNPGRRAKAANQIYNQIDDKTLADAFANYAEDRISNGQEIKIDDDLLEHVNRFVEEGEVPVGGITEKALTQQSEESLLHNKVMQKVRTGQKITDPEEKAYYEKNIFRPESEAKAKQRREKEVKEFETEFAKEEVPSASEIRRDEKIGKKKISDDGRAGRKEQGVSDVRGGVRDEEKQVIGGKASEAQEVKAKAEEAATSPTNEIPEPTPAQIEAGTYKKGHVKILKKVGKFALGKAKISQDKEGKFRIYKDKNSFAELFPDKKFESEAEAKKFITEQGKKSTVEKPPVSETEVAPVVIKGTIGRSPKVYEIIKKEPRKPGDLPEETFYTVRDKDGKTHVISNEDFIPLKRDAKKFEQFGTLLFSEEAALGEGMPMFAKGEAMGKLTVHELESAIDDIISEDGRKNLNIRVEESEANVKRKSREWQSFYDKGGRVEGVHRPGTGEIILFADNIKPGRVWPIILHESVHKVKNEGGWESVFGNKWNGIEKLINKRIADGDPKWKAATRKAVGVGTRTEKIFEETITHYLADNTNINQSLWRRMANAIRAWAINAGIKRKITNEDIVALAERAIQRAAKKGVKKTVVGKETEILKPAKKRRTIPGLESTPINRYNRKEADHVKQIDERDQTEPSEQLKRILHKSWRGRLEFVDQNISETKEVEGRAVPSVLQNALSKAYPNSEVVAYISPINGVNNPVMLEYRDGKKVFYVDMSTGLDDHTLLGYAIATHIDQTREGRKFIDQLIDRADFKEELLPKVYGSDKINEGKRDLITNMIAEGFSSQYFHDNFEPGVYEKFGNLWPSLVSSIDIHQKTKGVDEDGNPLPKAEREKIGFRSFKVDQYFNNPKVVKDSIIDTFNRSYGAKELYSRVYNTDQKEAIETGGFGKINKQSIRDRIDNARARLGLRLRQRIVDQFASFENLLKDRDSYMMAHLTKSDTGVLMSTIKSGAPELDKSGAIKYKDGSKSLRDILKSLGDEVDDFFMWIAGHRAEKLAKQGKEMLFTEKKYKALQTLNRGKMADGRNRSEVYEKARREFEELNNSIIKIGVESGLISKKEARIWESEGWYVPFYRLLEDIKARGPSNINSLVSQTAYKKLKGSEKQLDDILTNVLLNWNHIIAASLRNQAGAKALKSAERLNFADKVDPEFKSKKAVYIRENGKKVYYDLDDTQEGQLLLESLMSLHYEGMNNAVMKTARLFKRALTVGATADPGFKIRILIRDSIFAAAVTGVRPLNIPKNIYVGLQKEFKKETKSMEFGGGAFGKSGYIHGNDPDAIKRLIDSGVDQGTILNTKAKLKKIWQIYDDFGAKLENVNRIAEFERDIAKGKSLLEANFNARDQLDFTRTGTSGAIRTIAQVVPFLNAWLQGLDKLRRASLSKEQRGQLLTVMSMYTLASVLLYTAMKDDDDYKNTEDWKKRTYHLFKVPGSDKIYKIPRPFEIGAAAYMAEKMTEQFIDNNAETKLLKDEFINTLLDTFSFNPTPQIVKPAIEIYSNTNMFTGRSIENMGMKYLSKENRFEPWTSEIAKATSKGMAAVAPEKLTLSPVQLQHLVRAYTGWLGAFILSSADGAIKIATHEVTPETKWYEKQYQPLKSFMQDAAPRYSKNITTFYDNLETLNRTWADIKKYKGTITEQEIKSEKLDILKYRKLYNRASRNLGKLRKAKKRIYTDQELTASQKRKKIDEINGRMNKLAQEIVNLSREDF